MKGEVSPREQQKKPWNPAKAKARMSVAIPKMRRNFPSYGSLPLRPGQNFEFKKLATAKASLNRVRNQVLKKSMPSRNQSPGDGIGFDLGDSEYFHGGSPRKGSGQRKGSPSPKTSSRRQSIT
jgi:hypothetical protein